MDGSCGSVSLDRYWNNVAIPFLFIILGFGLYVLFSLSDIQFTNTEHIIRSVGAIAGSVRESSRDEPRYDPRDDPDDEPPPPAGNAPKKPATNANIMANAAKGLGKSPPAKNTSTKPATNANIMANLGKGVGK